MITNHKAMAHLSPGEQAMKALRHILTRIRDDSRVGWYLGWATESFELATEAYATLAVLQPIEVRREFGPKNPADPAEPAVIKQSADLDDDAVAALASYHETMAQTTRNAATAANMARGYGLHQQADRHEAWAAKLRSIETRRAVA